MNKLMVLLSMVLLSAITAVANEEPKHIAGGYSTGSVTNSDVVAAAAFAVKAEEKAMRESTNSQTAQLELIEIISAQGQVVAGMNYRLKLKVKLDGRDKEAEVVVWWQAWRTPDPYQLTSWSWKQSGTEAGPER